MRILLLSDIHGNLPALETVLAEAGPFDQVWCLGDLIGYGPYPNEVVDRVRVLPNLLCLVGNHDKAGLGQINLEAFNHEAREALEWTQETLSDSSRAFLGSLPEKLTERQYTLAHGSPRRPVWEYLLDTERARASFGFFGTPYCLVGHSHVALAFRLTAEGNCVLHLPSQGASLSLGQERMILNPGSVGQPRDQDPRASYAILDTDKGVWEWCRVTYDVKRVQDQMRSLGLPARLSLRLTEGW